RDVIETMGHLPLLVHAPFTVLEGFTTDYNCVGLALGVRDYVGFDSVSESWASALAYFAKKGAVLTKEIPPEQVVRIPELELPPSKGVDVLVLYSKIDKETGRQIFSHVVRQDSDGNWVSKMSERSPTIRFGALRDLAAGTYGNPTAVLVRP